MSRFFAEDFSTDSDFFEEFDDQGSQLSYEEVGDDVTEEQSNIKKSRFLAASDESDSDDAFQQRAIKSSAEKIRHNILSDLAQLNLLLNDADWISFNEILERLLKITHNFAKFCDEDIISSLGELRNSFLSISKSAKSKHSDALQSKALVLVSQKFKKVSHLMHKDNENDSELSSLNAISKEKFIPDSTSIKTFLDFKNRNFSDKIDNLSELHNLLAKSTCYDERISLLLAITSSKLEIIKSNFEPLHYFTEILEDLRCVVDIIPNVESQHIEANNVGVIIQSHLSRIDDEFFRILSNSSQENYISFLESEKKLIHIIYLGVEYLCTIASYEIICAFKLRILEHCYHRKENIISEALGKRLVVYELAEYIYKHGTAAAKAKALLYHCYHIALHGFPSKAISLLQKSKMFDFVSNLEPSEQVLYNRLLVQIGISSFQNCQIKDAYSSLFELCNSGRLKDLIGQMDYSQMKFSCESDKLPQLPLHIYFDTDLIDFVFITSSILIELIYNVSNLSKMERKFSQNKYLRKFIDQFHKGNYVGNNQSDLNDLTNFAIKLFACRTEEAKKIMFNNKIWKKYLGKPHESNFNLLINKIVNLVYCTRFGRCLDILDESLEINVPGN